MTDLAKCAWCARHIRRSEPSCPFCGALNTREISGAGRRVLPRARLGRAALLAFAASTACGGVASVDGTNDGKQSSTGGTSTGGSSTPFEGAGASNDGNLLFGSGGTGADGPINQGGTTNAGGRGYPGASYAGIYGAPPPPNSGSGGTGGVAGSGGKTSGDSDGGPDLDSGTPDGAANNDGAANKDGAT